MRKYAILILAAATLGASLNGAFADTLVWTNTAGGFFLDPGNWKANKVPGGLDTTEVYSNGTYTVTLDGDANVTNLTAKSGVIGLTFDLNGRTLTSASNGIVAVATVAGSAIDWTVKSSAPGGVFNLFQLDVFKTLATTRGSISILGANTTVNVTNGSTGDNMVMNYASNTIFTVSDGAHLNVSQTLIFGIGLLPAIARNQTPTINPYTTMTVSGTGTTYSNLLKSIIIGKAGTNMPSVVVSNSAVLYTQGINIGSGGDTWYSYSPKANGKLVVTGTNSYCDGASLSMSALAGEYGTTGSTAGGRVVVEKGGVLNLRGGATLSTGYNQYYPSSGLNAGAETNLNAYGEVIVRNPGSLFKTAGNVKLTELAQGAVYVLDGATWSSGASATFTLAGGVNGTVQTNSWPLTNSYAYGLCVISNANSSASFNKVNFSDSVGYSDLIVADNARLSVTNGTGCSMTITNRCRLTVSDAFAETQTLNVRSNATIRIGLGARAHTSAYITATAAVTLDPSAKLDINILANATINSGDTIKLLAYTGTRTGTFKDLPEGAALFVNGRRFRIYYGTGSNSAITVRYLPMGSLIRVL